MLVFTSVQEVLRIGLRQPVPGPGRRPRRHHRSAATMTTAPQLPGAGRRPSLVGPVVRAGLVRGLAVTLVLGLVAVLARVSRPAPRVPPAPLVGAGAGVRLLRLRRLRARRCVSTVSPTASLLVALLTYTLQVVLVGVRLRGPEPLRGLGTSIDERWLAGIAHRRHAGLAAAAQILAHTTGRQPLVRPPVRLGRPGGCAMTRHDCYCPVRDDSATSAAPTAQGWGPVARVRIPHLRGAAVRRSGLARGPRGWGPRSWSRSGSCSGPLWAST